ncbi:MAG: DUF6268 family outer membrane beta-barrel protein [Prevotella sp.]|jgi:hypothetical protein|nr:DUF6268 family outer membrane beta-barrel protein [Prevotella sp.]
MRTIPFILILLFSVTVFNSYAQGYLKSEYLLSSSFKDKERNKIGSGDLMKYSGGFNIPLSTKLNDLGQPTAWSVSLYGAYGILNNKDMTENINPDEIINTSLNLTHVRPISKKWSLMVSLGGGVYAAPDDITAKSILFNGGAIFVYKVRDNLDLGIGSGLTNAYGVPLIMPMFVFNWRLSGKYEVNIDIASGMQIAAAIKFSDRFKLKLTAIEFDGMSSVVEVDGKSMIYASTNIKSFLSPEFKIGKSSTLYLGGGGTWVRSVTFAKRSFKGFLDNFKDDKSMDFNPTGYFVAGFRYGF